MDGILGQVCSWRFVPIKRSLLFLLFIYLTPHKVPFLKFPTYCDPPGGQGTKMSTKSDFMKANGLTLDDEYLLLPRSE